MKKHLEIVDKKSIDGLRFKSKAAGSRFGPGDNHVLSCIKCGKHVARTSLRPFKLAGAQHYACIVPCGKLKTSTATSATQPSDI